MGQFGIRFETLTPSLTVDLLHGPAGPTSVVQLARWQQVEHGDGKVTGFCRSLVPLWEWAIDLPNLRDADFEAIETFYAEVNGNSDLWLYTHTDERQYEVRFWSQPQYRRLNSNFYEGSIVLLSTEEPNGEPS